MSRRTFVAVVAVLLLASCARGYEDENREIVEELPTIDGSVLLSEEHYGYCSSDSCLLGNDRSGALLMYTIDTDEWTQIELAEAYRDHLVEWEDTIGEDCLNSDPSFCDEIVFASFAREDERIVLNLDNWPAGRFEVAVDAQGAQ